MTETAEGQEARRESPTPGGEGGSALRPPSRQQLLREQLLAALRGVSTPLTTAELQDLIPYGVQPQGSEFQCTAHPTHDVVPSPRIRLLERHGSWQLLAARRHPGEVYAALRGLEKKGLCGRIKHENSRSVLWYATAGKWTEDVDQLERLWRHGAAEHGEDTL